MCPSLTMDTRRSMEPWGPIPKKMVVPLSAIAEIANNPKPWIAPARGIVSSCWSGKDPCSHFGTSLISDMRFRSRGPENQGNKCPQPPVT